MERKLKRSYWVLNNNPKTDKWDWIQEEGISIILEEIDIPLFYTRNGEVYQVRTVEGGFPLSSKLTLRASIDQARETIEVMGDTLQERIERIYKRFGKPGETNQ